MTCQRTDLGGGAVAWSCSRGTAEPAAMCSSCGAAGARLTCQFELGGAKAGQPCGRALCRSCERRDACDRVLCPAHHRLVTAGASGQRGEQ